VLPALCAALTSGGPARAQTGQWKPEPSSLCGRDNALSLVRQQLDAAKAFDDAARRVAVMLRAADLLWPYRQDEAREAFAAAFELAARDFREHGDEPKREGLALSVDVPDQRYVVIRAVARRDPAWAKRLTEEALKADRQEAESATAASARRDSDARTATKLLDAASALLPSNPEGASAFAEASLKFPAGLYLTYFMYGLAEVNQKVADQFYRKALAAYGDRPVREFLYLSAYPFGLAETGDMPVSGPYRVPAAFKPDPALKRLFVQTLLRRAALALQVPLDEGDNYNGFPGTGHILQVLTRLEPHVRRDLPDMAGALEQARNNLLSSLPQDNQDAFQRSLRAQGPSTPKTFEELVEAAEAADPNHRDYLLSEAILDAGAAESADRVATAADKMSDARVRAQLLDWLYFGRAQAALSAGQFDEATRLASKVQEMDQRAYLYSQIAKEYLPRLETQNQARVLLDEIVTTAARRPDSVVAARALLSAAYMYLKIDPNRALSLMAEAVKSVNSVEGGDFSRQDFFRKIEGKDFARYTHFRAPGFDPENAFGELAKVDFDGALSLAGTLSDKALRARTTLVLAEFCLRREAEQKKAVNRKP
jgi:hypothetical protein